MTVRLVESQTPPLSLIGQLRQRVMAAHNAFMNKLTNGLALRAAEKALRKPAQAPELLPAPPISLVHGPATQRAEQFADGQVAPQEKHALEQERLYDQVVLMVNGRHTEPLTAQEEAFLGQCHVHIAEPTSRPDLEIVPSPPWTTPKWFGHKTTAAELWPR